MNSLAALTAKERVILACVVAATVAAGALHYLADPTVIAFVVSALALAGVAWVVSFATEQLGENFGPAVTGIMQSTLGNLPEFFVVVFALSAGQTVVAQTSIIGSILANALLVLGLTIMIGSSKSEDSVMMFHRRLPRDTATLLLLSIFMIAMISAFQTGHKGSVHDLNAISIIGAVLLLGVYLSWAVPYVRSNAAGDPAHREPARLAAKFAGVLLALAGVAAALVSEWFVASLEPAMKALGWSEVFTGLIVVAIAGNAVENATALVLAKKRQNELAISVVKNSVAQIAAFLLPALVLVSFAFAAPLTFAMAPIYITALVVTAIAVWQITGDGEAAFFEGAALVALYVLIAAVAFFE
jgi:Ca2+:H+ antiporter